MSAKVVTFDNVEITGGFWKKRQAINRKTTVYAVYEQFKKTGRFDAFKLKWREGMPQKPDIYWDSDVAKWMEAVAYFCQKRRDPELEAIVDEVVDDIERGRMADGYYNSYYNCVCPEKRFTNRDNHELYCAGHLLEAAIAYDKATGKGKFLNLMIDYMVLIERLFMIEQSVPFKSPGHEEIELALVKLFDYTGDIRWLNLSMWFIEHRDSSDVADDYPYGAAHTQSHMKPRNMETAEGHAVRAVYLYSAMADLALRCKDENLAATCEKLFNSISYKKMYITGGIGSSFIAGEAFEEDYRLPNDTSYAETCAAIGLALFARRMSCLFIDGKYADVVERVIYNGFLSGSSLDGKAFFYENPQEIDLVQRELLKTAIGRPKDLHLSRTQRAEYFDCSCCPPNILRFLSSIGDLIYNTQNNTVFVNQYISSVVRTNDMIITQKTNYPIDGRIAFQIDGGNSTMLAFRIPGWCHDWELTRNGKKIDGKTQNGYVYTAVNDGDELILDLTMKVRFVNSNPRVIQNRGLSAVCYGPLVMCLEGIDNGGWLGNVHLLRDVDGTVVTYDDQLDVLSISMPAVRVKTDSLYYDECLRESFIAKLIPYYAFANRGESDMRIWVKIE